MRFLQLAVHQGQVSKKVTANMVGPKDCVADMPSFEFKCQSCVHTYTSSQHCWPHLSLGDGGFGQSQFTEGHFRPHPLLYSLQEKQVLPVHQERTGRHQEVRCVYSSSSSQGIHVYSLH